MFFVYGGIYILFAVMIWGFFGVAWIHAHKFKNFSTHIIPVSRILLVFLILLTIIGFFLIATLSSKISSFSIQRAEDTPLENQNYY